MLLLLLAVVVGKILEVLEEQEDIELQQNFP
jgi:hypothetical protein